MNLQDENELDWQVMASNWSRFVCLHCFLLSLIAAQGHKMFFLLR